MSLVNTRMQNMRANSDIDKNELRPSRYGALDVFVMDTNTPGGIISPELKQKATESVGRLLEVPVVDFDGDITIGNTRTLTIGDSENTSQMFSIIFTPFTFGFTVVPSLYMNNEIGIQKDFERKMKKYIYKFAETLDSSAIAALAAAKTQDLGDKLVYDFTSNTIVSPWKQRENILGDLGPMFASNDYYGSLRIIGNGGVESLINKLAQKSIYNDVNKTNEWSDKTFHFTNRLGNDVGNYATGYAVEEGQLGFLQRFERECLLGTTAATGHEWGIETLPMLGIPCGTYYYESVGDFSGIAGSASADMTRVRKQHYGFAVDIAFVVPYNSDPENLASPIAKFVIKSETDTDFARVVVANTTASPVNTKEVV